MNRFVTFTSKEFTEWWRSYRMLILFAVLALFGMMSPLLAKITPDIFKSIDLGFELNIPDPVFGDSYAQFFKNMTQMGILVIILIFGGTITAEKQKGTAVLMFSKGLSRSDFILSKFTTSVLIWTGGFLLSLSLFYGYTQYLFPDQAPKNFLLAMFSLWLFAVLLIATGVLAGALFSSSYLPILSTFGLWAALMIVSVFPKTEQWNPNTLISVNQALILGQKTLDDVWISLLITGVLIVAFVGAAVMIFRKKEL